MNKVVKAVQPVNEETIKPVNPKTQLPEYEQMILRLANKHGLGGMREDSIERWFKLVELFDSVSQPACNVLLWYIKGKQDSVDKLIEAGLEKSGTVRFDKEHIERVRKVMFDINFK